MIKKITTIIAGTQEGGAFPAFDVIDSVDFNNAGEAWIADPNGALAGKYAEDDEITVEIGEIIDGAEVTDTIFKGLIADVDESDRIHLTLAGYGRRLQQRRYRRSYHLIDAERIIKDLLTGTGIQYVLGAIPRGRRHTHVCANGSIWQELGRLNSSWGLGLVPYFTRDGVLILKTEAEAGIDTDIEYGPGQFKKLEANRLHLPLDQEIEAMMKIKVLGQAYQVAEHRMIHNERETASIIGLAKI